MSVPQYGDYPVAPMASPIPHCELNGARYGVTEGSNSQAATVPSG